MKQVLLNIPDNKYPFFMELMKSLDFVQVQDELKEVETKVKLTEEQKNELMHIKRAFEQVELLKQGKIKTRPAEDFLNEL